MSFLSAAVVVGAGSAIVSGIQSANAASDQRAYNAEVTRLQSQYRLDVMAYQNYGYAQDVKFYRDQVEWEKAEFQKNKDHAFEMKEVADQDFFGKIATQMTAIVEQDMAEAFGVQDVRRQVYQEMGAVSARVADRGIGGNVVQQLQGEVERQGGDAINMTHMNADVARSQAILGLQGLRAEHGAALSQITIPTFQPLQAPRAAAPVSPINPAAPVSGPSVGSIVLGAASAGINLGAGVKSLIK